MYVARYAGVALIALGLAAAGPLQAQDKAKKAERAPVSKVLLENDKVKVIHSTFKPGDVSPSRERKPRVSYAVQGGTLERTYPDGKKVKSERKTGEALWLGLDTYAVKNIGKTTVVLVGTEVK